MLFGWYEAKKIEEEEKKEEKVLPVSMFADVAAIRTVTGGGGWP